MNTPELKKRIIYTLLMFLVARIGTLIPVPGVDLERLASMVNDNSVLGFINMFSGGAFQRVSIFALGVMPYINASIVMSLLAVIIPVKLDTWWYVYLNMAYKDLFLVHCTAHPTKLSVSACIHSVTTR